MTTTRQPGFARLFIPLLAFACLLAASCYTLVQHPRVASLDYRRPDGACSRCHSAREVRAFLRQERLAAPRPPWDSLTHPWWIPSDSTGGGE